MRRFNIFWAIARKTLKVWCLQRIWVSDQWRKSWIINGGKLLLSSNETDAAVQLFFSFFVSSMAGAKCGEYGSFLPTYERSPSVQSHPKTPQKNHFASRSPGNLPMEVYAKKFLLVLWSFGMKEIYDCLTSLSTWEILFYLSTVGCVNIQGASQNEKASSNAPQSVRPISSSSQSSHNARVPSGSIPLKKESCLRSTQVTEKCSLKNESSKRSSNLTDQRTLKFRIKMGSDNMAQKNAIYSGLGLDDSPSSSLGNSPVKGGGLPPAFQESPSSIIQVVAYSIVL